MTRTPIVSGQLRSEAGLTRTLVVWLHQRLAEMARIFAGHRTVNRRAARPPNVPANLREDVGLPPGHEPKRHWDVR